MNFAKIHNYSIQHAILCIFFMHALLCQQTDKPVFKIILSKNADILA